MDIESRLIEAISGAISDIQEDSNARLEESIAQVKYQLAAEDEGWALLGSHISGDHLEGLDLDEAKEISEPPPARSLTSA